MMLEVAEDYLSRGWAVLPLKHRDKNPGNSVGNGWEALRLTEDDLPEWFNGHPQNVGVLLGEPSDWLIDIDLDHPDAVAMADHFLPDTCSEFGRASKVRSHRLYRLTEPAPTKKWKHKKLGTVLEFRSTGAQTVFPHSTHDTSGELIGWARDGEPTLIEPNTLIAACQRLYEAVCLKAGVVPVPERQAPAPVKPVDSSTVPDGYARKALEGELRRVQDAPRPAPGMSGGRNDALFLAARNCGELVATGLLDQAYCESQLFHVASEVDLPPEEARKTISSGMMAGLQKPRDLSGVGTKRREAKSQNATLPNYQNDSSAERDPSEAPCIDDDSGNYFLDLQRRGEVKYNSGIGSGFGNVDPEEPEPKQDDLPFAPQSVADLLEQNTALRIPVIEGLMRQGETGNVIAAPKVGKSHLALEAGVAVVTGGKFLGKYACTQGRVLLIDNELHPQTLASRIRRLIVKRQMDVSDIAGLEVECLRGRLRDLHAMSDYFESIEHGRYSLIIIDALYRMLPKDVSENDNAGISALYNTLDRHAEPALGHPPICGLVLTP